MPPDEPIPDRQAVRAVLLAPDRRILLMRFREPSSGVALWVSLLVEEGYRGKRPKGASGRPAAHFAALVREGPQACRGRCR